MSDLPETRYVKNGDVNIAFQVSGAGTVDLLHVGQFSDHLELDWELPASATFLRRLGSFARLIRMNRRGVGLSDRRTPPTAVEEEIGDILAVLDAATSYRAFVMGANEGVARAALLAASHPARVAGLVLYAGYARAQPADDFEAAPPGLVDTLVASVEQTWGRGYATQLVAPGASPELRAWLDRQARASLGPGDAALLMRLVSELDIRAALPSIAAPTLVLHRRADPLVPIAQSRYLAEHIPDARLVELEGDAHTMYLGDSEAVLAEIEQHVTGERPVTHSTRALTTVLFTDIVASTERAADLGDAAWRELVEEHDRTAEAIVTGFGGRLVKTTGDGAVATFDGPARAIRCALALQSAAREIGVEVRAGLHTAEVEVLEHDLAGIGVHIAARVGSLADGDEVLVTSTVKDLVAGSGIEFDDAGVHTLKGVPDEWHLYRVRSA